jgi:hypothetical protein
MSQEALGVCEYCSKSAALRSELFVKKYGLVDLRFSMAALEVRTTVQIVTNASR